MTELANKNQMLFERADIQKDEISKENEERMTE